MECLITELVYEFFNVYNPTQFEIVGLGLGNFGTDIGISANLSEEECKSLKEESNDGFRRGKLCFRLSDGKLKIPFTRIVVKRKK